MENNATVVAVTAVAALAATVVVDRVMRVRERRQDASQAARAAHNEGWYQGRESVIQHFAQNAVPQDFTTR